MGPGLVSLTVCQAALVILDCKWQERGESDDDELVTATWPVRCRIKVWIGEGGGGRRRTIWNSMVLLIKSTTPFLISFLIQILYATKSYYLTYPFLLFFFLLQLHLWNLPKGVRYEFLRIWAELLTPMADLFTQT